MNLYPIGRKFANEIVARFHRHHSPKKTHKFSQAAIDDLGNILGVAICDRPVARYLDDTWTIEVSRLCVPEGPQYKNVNSFLYGACARIAREMGYRRILTYILDSEPGTSLRAAGWVRTGITKPYTGQGWGSRWVKADYGPKDGKQRFERSLPGIRNG